MASKYIQRLRRAFLLKVHPDRFRRHPEEVRKQQAILIQSLSDRMEDHDFIAFSSSSLQSHRDNNHHQYRIMILTHL